MCRLESLGNCDPETKDQEYCIFHKPNKTPEEAKKFYRKFLEKTKPKKEKENGIKYYHWQKLDCRGYVFPPPPEGFEQIFRNALINEADFSRAKFYGIMNFQGARFIRVNFREANFYKEVDFSEATFSEASFQKAKFHGETKFWETTFHNEINFRKTEFHKRVDFWRAKFCGRINFSEAKFYGAAEFLNTRFEKYGEANFERAEFHKQVSFKETKFKKKAIFSRTIFKYKADFKETSFEDEVYFTNVVLYFTNVVYSHIINLDHSKYLLPITEYLALAVQRQVYEKTGDIDSAEKVFLKSMRARRKSYLFNTYKKYLNNNDDIKNIAETIKDKTSSIVREILFYLIHVFTDYTSKYTNNKNNNKDENTKNEKWYKLSSYIRRRSRFIGGSLAALAELLLVDLTCEYGTNWRRPILLWVFLVMMVFPFLYWLVNGVSSVESPVDYIYFSVITATTVGFGDIHPIGLGRVLSSIEAVFGTFMWAVYLTVMARKYMR